jgi:hypothetical protein
MVSVVSIKQPNDKGAALVVELLPLSSYLPTYVEPSPHFKLPWQTAEPPIASGDGDIECHTGLLL